MDRVYRHPLSLLDTLKEYFAQFGNVINVNIIYVSTHVVLLLLLIFFYFCVHVHNKDVRTGFTKGYGFVKMETEEGVKKVFSKEQHYLAPNHPVNA